MSRRLRMTRHCTWVKTSAPSQNSGNPSFEGPPYWVGWGVRNPKRSTLSDGQPADRRRSAFDMLRTGASRLPKACRDRREDAPRPLTLAPAGMPDHGYTEFVLTRYLV